jgi:peptidyl-tRNA hydrolase, PTH2 family
MGTAKQVIVLRGDLEMPPGKAASQAAHASIAFLSTRLSFMKHGEGILHGQFSEPELEWLEGSFTKIVLRATTLEDLMHVYYEAQDHFLEAHLIIDEGRTVFEGIPTPTAVAIGPDYPGKIDPITGGLRLYK